MEIIFHRKEKRGSLVGYRQVFKNPCISGFSIETNAVHMQDSLFWNEAKAVTIKEETLSQVFLHHTKNGKRSAFATSLVDEINGLLGVALSSQGSRNEDHRVCLDDLSARTTDAVMDKDYGFARDETLELIALLTAGQRNSVRGFVYDVADILFLDREQRTEYVNNEQVAPPYKIHKLMLEYAMKSKHVDDIVGALTKPYCAASCHKLPTGCCYILGYDLGLVPKTMLRLQAVEARRNGHITPRVEDKCKYHTPTGCTLSLFKSPACIGYLCDGLIGSLEEAYPEAELNTFFKHLEIFRNCHIDRSQVFDAMDGLIAAGRKLVEISSSTPAARCLPDEENRP